MKMIKRHKQDILILLLFSAIYLIIAAILTHGDYYFAAVTDFPMQHYVFPEYFRNLFYETKDLFPDFALNIGGGQNIYNFSYYGLLNPYILISYLLPMIPMFYYLIASSFIIVVISTFLFYKFLESKKLKKSTCIIVALLFLFATPILYHAKRHIMFINYFPFLILGLFGVDRFIKTKKSTLLTISILLMTLTSFYYSVSGIVVLIIYGIYEFYKKKKEKIWQFLISFAKPFIVAVCISAILWLPTAYTLLIGRGESIEELETWLLFVPSLKCLYSAFSPGITILEFILIGVLAIDKKIEKRTRILATTLMIILIIPIFNYILNGTLYLNEKSLIPFLPLLLYLVAISIENLEYHKKKVEGFLIVTTCIITVAGNFTDPLIPKDKEKTKEIENYKELVNKVTKNDQGFYRIGNETETSSALNRVFNMEEYKSSIYSSTQNKGYVDWLKKDLKTNQIYRNNMMITLSGNVFAESLMGEKYIITTKNLEDGYTLLDKKGNLKVYQNNFALPIIYASTNTISEKEYKTLSYPENVIATYTKDNPDDTKLEKVELKIKNYKNLNYKIKNNTIRIKAKENASMTVEPTENIKDKILFITFKNKFNRGCHHGKNDQTIKINDISNKLTCRDWKYHNNNYTFHYILVSPEEIEITFSEAYYKLGNIEIYALPKSILEERKEEVTPMKINHKKTIGDTITGTITVDENSHIEVAIPYDNGFQVKVDNKVVKYQKSLQNGLTFPISKGKHKIEITYKAPWKNIATIISIFGILLWIGIIIKERKRT